MSVSVGSTPAADGAGGPAARPKPSDGESVSSSSGNPVAQLAAQLQAWGLHESASSLLREAESSKVPADELAARVSALLQPSSSSASAPAASSAKPAPAFVDETLAATGVQRKYRRKKVRFVVKDFPQSRDDWADDEDSGFYRVAAADFSPDLIRRYNAVASVLPRKPSAAALITPSSDGSSSSSSLASASSSDATAPDASSSVPPPSPSPPPQVPVEDEYETDSEDDGPPPRLRGPNDPDAFEHFDLRVIYVKMRTGFEETKDFPIKLNSVIAERYQILEYIGSAAFSKAVQCLDLVTGDLVCIKIIKNNKDFLDQSLDEIKLLKYINSRCDPDRKHVVQLYDYFYYKEHLFIVCELLRDNLYEFYKYNRESGDELYFTIPRLQRIAKQILISLKYVHHLGLLHSDLKPENILIRSYSRCQVKVIDFGSSCFVTDHLSSYVQSRSYRAPEVMLGLPYGPKIDLWSLGCILAELWTGQVLFLNDSVATLLARVIGIIGPIPQDMMERGRYVHKYFTADSHLYDKDEEHPGSFCYLLPKKTSLEHRLKTHDKNFLDFLRLLLQINPDDRPNAAAMLQHPFLAGVPHL